MTGGLFVRSVLLFVAGVTLISLGLLGTNTQLDQTD